MPTKKITDTTEQKVGDMYYSQFGEDNILSEIFRDKRSGTCIEVGANDGVNDSTTLYFEKIGWNCILIEPNPVLCQMIRSARSSPLYECAVSDKHGKATLYVAEGSERSHGVSTLCGDNQSLNKIKSYGFTYRPVQVETRTLDEILVDLKINSSIDFVSIDVEGHEIESLKGFSIGQWSPTVILIEDNSSFRDAIVRNYMNQFGYVCFNRTGVNDWYAHRENRELVNLRSRSRYNWIFFKTRVKNNLKKILRRK